MLRKITLVSLFLIASFGLRAQYKTVLFGLHGGVNLSWMKSSDENYVNEAAKIGGSWGFIAEFFLMENYAIMTGFNIDYNGGKLSYPDMRIISPDTTYTLGNTTRKYNLQYIEIPIALKMQTRISEKVRAYGKIGLGTSFRLKSRAEDSFVYTGQTIKDKKKDIEDDISLLRQSLILGVGVEFNLYESTAMIIDFTFDNGFSDILKGNSPVDPETNQKANLNYLQLGVGILF